MLVGTKFDSALYDVYRRFDDPGQAIVTTEEDLRRQAASVFAAFQKQHAPASRAHEILESLKQPIFVSSMAHLIAERADRLTEDEQFFRNKLNKLWRPLTHEEFQEIGNFAAMRERLLEVAGRTQPLLEKKLAGLAGSSRDKAIAQLADLSGKAERNLVVLERTDQAQLAKQREVLTACLKEAEQEVTGLFEALTVQAESRHQELVNRLKAAQNRFSAIQAQTAVRTEEYEATATRTTYNWWDVMGWFPKEESYTVTKTRSIPYQYARLEDALGRIDEYANAVTFDIERALNGLMNAERFRARLKEAVMRPLEHQNVRPEVLSNAVDRVVARLVLPQVSLQGASYAQQLANQFSAEVEEHRIEELRTKTRQAIAKLLKDVDKRLGGEVRQFQAQLATLQSGFLDQVLASVVREIDRLEREMVEKAAEMEGYRQLIQQLDADLAAAGPALLA
ncbi:hypothetical protein D3C72_942830 [compost metagenome]